MIGAAAACNRPHRGPRQRAPPLAPSHQPLAEQGGGLGGGRWRGWGGRDAAEGAEPAGEEAPQGRRWAWRQCVLAPPVDAGRRGGEAGSLDKRQEIERRKEWEKEED